MIQARAIWSEVVSVYLLTSPLWPKVPCQGCSNAKEGEHHKQPQNAIKDVEFSVKGVADPVDRAPTCVLFCCLSKSSFLQCFLHVFLFISSFLYNSIFYSFDHSNDIFMLDSKRCYGWHVLPYCSCCQWSCHCKRLVIIVIVGFLIIPFLLWKSLAVVENTSKEKALNCLCGTR